MLVLNQTSKTLNGFIVSKKIVMYFRVQYISLKERRESCNIVMGFFSVAFISYRAEYKVATDAVCKK